VNRKLISINYLHKSKKGKEKKLNVPLAFCSLALVFCDDPGGPKIAPLVDRLKEAPGRLATYVKHLAKSIPNQVLAYMKSYFPMALVDVVAGGLAANCTDGQYKELLEQMAPIAEQAAEKLNLQ
jgi:hypothetical protein